MKKRNNLIFGILLFAFLLPVALFAQNSEKITTVVIDAGHGGKDPGVINKTTKTQEKDVTLSVAMLTGEYIKKNNPDVNVIYTRDKDVYVKLTERAKIANEANADVFISIHCNGSSSTIANGVEISMMGGSKDELAFQVFKKENPALSDSCVHLLLQQRKDRSLILANNVHAQLLKRKGSVDRGVKQHNDIYVLLATTMPSILIDLGFLTNDEEGAYLASEAGQKEMANAIYQAFSDFKKEYEK